LVPSCTFFISFSYFCSIQYHMPWSSCWKCNFGLHKTFKNYDLLTSAYESLNSNNTYLLHVAVYFIICKWFFSIKNSQNLSLKQLNNMWYNIYLILVYLNFRIICIPHSRLKSKSMRKYSLLKWCSFWITVVFFLGYIFYIYNMRLLDSPYEYTIRIRVWRM
jgi:hypothetical protein